MEREVIPIVDYDDTAASSHAKLLVVVTPPRPAQSGHDLIIAASTKATPW